MPECRGHRSKFENHLQLNQRRPQVTHTGKRAEETTSLGAGFECHEHPGIVVAGGNLQIGKGLIVHQRGVVGGADILDQTRLLQQGIDFAGWRL